MFKPSTFSSLKPFLDQVFHSYHRVEHLCSDPLEFLHQFDDPWDQEVVGLVASQLAYGNVRQIRKSVDNWIELMRQTVGLPSVFVREGLSDPRVRASCRGFVHRLHRGDALLALLDLVSESWKRFGSVGAHLISHLEDQDLHFERGLNGLLRDWKGLAKSKKSIGLSRSLQHFLAAPESGSCCKRWCMFLRWMVRQDQIDRGIWLAGSPLLSGLAPGKGLSASQLMIPLDTHVGQICQLIGMTSRKSLNWKAVQEITAVFREVCPEDPIKYDFALARIGILDQCRKRFISEVCNNCSLRSACRIVSGLAKA